MSVTAWRIIKPRRASTAFDGEGARLSGGRWNSPGVSVVYTAGTASLALLEILVHPPIDHLYVVIPVTLDDSLVDASISVASLPANWNASPAPVGLAAIGDRWAVSGTLPVLRVPSAIVPFEWNYLLNPNHSAFARLTIGTPIPIAVDARLVP